MERVTEHKRLTTKEKHPHGAEGVSKDKLTGKYCRGVFEATACVEKLAEYETAEEEGRLVVLPCKVGQDLFGIYNRTIIDGYADGYLLEKTSVHSDADHWIWLQDKNSKNYWKVSFDEIGKTVFLTREEAEKALKETEGKHE